MAKTHEVNLTSSLFSSVRDNNYYITKNNDYEVEDYVLFNEVETVDESVQQTGVNKMTRIKDVISNEGLKDEYVLLFLTSLS